ncbi:putative ferric-chelate reductase 1 homolog isoform X2 [Culicoides brevitarsis]|uniref:putative ferric-chelate reductase 1 homolog isoform X2 n=1 Tax=Culicoides brevitarsis TaxID=469753 RepID=UPI00307BA014
MLPCFLVLFFFVNSFTTVVCLPNGAPESTCESLLPFHGGGIKPLTTVSPFNIVPLSTVVEQGQVLRVEIQADPRELVFGGFMIHARTRTTPYRVVGRFAKSADGTVKLINCGDGVENTATHVSPAPKLDFGLDWQAPNDYVGEIYFIATIAQEYDKFWVGIQSESIRIVTRGSLLSTPSNGISTSRRPFHQPTSFDIVPNRTKITKKLGDPFYDQCGDTKSCFGFPEGCVEQKNCKAAVATIVNGESYVFEMKAFDPNAAYVASALSMDNKMGDDSVMECVPERGQGIKAYASWTFSSPKYGVTRENVPQSIVKLIDSSYTNNQIYCRVERDALSVVRGVSFDLVRNKYNILVASGSSNKDNSVGYHDIGRESTASARALAEISNFGTASKLFLRLHGAFMVAAWIGTASLGILLARYFKQTWIGSSSCGKDIWFAWHRFLMFLTWVLTMAGTILIVLELKGWSKARNPHAVLGSITTILCFLQPIGAFFRPHPGSKNRPIFNWMHWLGGNVAHIIGVVAIFFAVKLSKAELPDWLDYILVAFVAFHVLLHLIFSIAGCASDRRTSQRVTSFPMTDMSPPRTGLKSTERAQDAPYSKLRRSLLGIYTSVLVLIVAALIFIIVLAPIDQKFEALKSQMMK